MKGVFKVSYFQYVASALMLACGFFLAARFATFGLDEIKEGHLAPALFSFCFSAFGFLLSIAAYFGFRHNRGAYLSVNDTKIDAHFGWSGELHTDLSDISRVSTLFGGKGLKLVFGDKVIYITNLENARDVFHFLSTRIDESSVHFPIELIEKNMEKSKKKYDRMIRLVISLLLLLFLNIVWCVVLTKGRDFNEYTESDTIVFIVFLFLELVTILLSLFAADRCGKQHEIYQMCLFEKCSLMATIHKRDSLELYPNIIATKYFHMYTYRIVMFSPKSDIFAYMLERFELKTMSWVYCYQDAKGFSNLSDLYEDVDSCFSDVNLKD